jgi:hypothetical protein
MEVIKSAGKTSSGYNAAGTAVGILGIISQILNAAVMAKPPLRMGT